MVKGLCTLLLLSGVSTGFLWAQDTIIALPLVSVEALPLRMTAAGEYAEIWTGPDLHSRPWMSVAQVLSRTSGMYMRHYGPGTLSVSSLRGGSAAQTAILWNGIPIQSPMTGLMDMSQLPVVLVDRVGLHHGSSGARWGSGAVGGALHIDQLIPAVEGWGLRGQSSTGSFGHHMHTLHHQFRTRNWATATRAFIQRAVNDFPYRVHPDLPARRQRNARIRQEGLMQEAYWMPGRGHELSAHLWWQRAQREIPPLTTQSRSEAHQADRALRSSLHWRWQDARHKVHTRVAWTNEDLDYRDPSLKLQALSGFHQVLSEADYHYSLLPKVQLMGGVRQIYSSSDAAGYAATASQQRMNIYAGMRWTHRSWSVQGQLMQEWVDGRSAPIQPELGMDWNREGPVSVHARVARHYRWPTLNDLHWSPGGNADLQPEYGWSQEVGLGARPARGLTLRVNAWRRHMKDWIMWTLTPGQFFWSAHNVTEVISYGLEARLAYRQPLGAAVFHLESGWDPLRSINQVSIQAPRLEAGQDLLYTPRQQGFLELGCTYQGLTMYYTHRLTGSVRGINEDVAAYDLGWAGIAWSSVWAGSEGRLFLEVANVWDRAYRIVERRPMPGRSFEFGISFNFHKPKP